MTMQLEVSTEIFQVPRRGGSYRSPRSNAITSLTSRLAAVLIYCSDMYADNVELLAYQFLSGSGGLDPHNPNLYNPQIYPYGTCVHSPTPALSTGEA